MSRKCTRGLKNVLSVGRDDFEAKYLGLPTPDGRMHNGKFQNLQERLAKRILLWGNQSQGGKEVLIKAVAQALPTYIMGVFKLPFELCDDLTRMMGSYWWGAENGKRKTHWVAWEDMVKPKGHGGMGFRDMRLFNQALLARQAWRLLQFPDSLCARVLKAKYYPNGVLTDTVFTGNASSTWHAIEYGLDLLKKGIIWRVGNGANIRTWRDPWIPRSHQLRPITARGRCRLRWVADFIDPNGNWNMTLIRQHFLDVDIAEIIKIKPSRRNQEDFLAWHPKKRGIFTVRSAYRLALDEQMRNQGSGASSSRPSGYRPDWKLIWQCPVPPKVRIFGWKLASNALATQENMYGRGMEEDPTCIVCGREPEDAFHAMMRCPHARDLWAVMRQEWSLPAERTFVPTGPEWILQALRAMTEQQRAMVLMILWRIWHSHNEITHNKEPPTVQSSKHFLVSYLNSLMLIQQHPVVDVEKGKQVVNYVQGCSSTRHSSDGRQKVRQKWEAPSPDHVKLNVDGSFMPDGSAGTGMALRDSNGTSVFVACRYLFGCADAVNAELAAMEEGLVLALHWSPLPLSLETDCAEAVVLVQSSTPNTARYSSRVQNIHELLRERDVLIFKISREANCESWLSEAR